MDYLNYIIYVIVFGFSFYLVFKVLRALNVEGLFKQGKILEIKIFYIIACIICSHVLASFVVYLLEFFTEIIKKS
ncbi:MAG: DUF1146 family protein [Acholeplasmatales bacterium]|jgi:uncharacterized membrane protein YwzB|nr:DUF1146 family protein [Acholeplasmatales bacterium]